MDRWVDGWMVGWRMNYAIDLQLTNSFAAVALEEVGPLLIIIITVAVHLQRM